MTDVGKGRFLLSLLMGSVLLFFFIDGRLWHSHASIISDLANYSCHIQTAQMGETWVHNTFGNQLVPYYNYYNECGITIAPAFYYLVGAEVVTLFTCWFGLIPFLIQYIKDKSVENSFDELVLLPLYKQWKFLVCVGILSFVWGFFWVEYFVLINSGFTT